MSEDQQMVECGNAEFKDRQVCALNKEVSAFQAIPSFCK